MLDPVRNFINIVVPTGYDSDDTEIVLGSGDGALLPDPETEGAFNLTWFNSSDYPNPADDPNVEIVRVTAIDTDTLTVTRAQEGTSGSTKNAGGKVYKLILAPTKKLIDDLPNLGNIESLLRRAVIDGSTTPVPVCISGGTIVPSDADVSALAAFMGFVDTNEAVGATALPLNGASSSYLPNGASSYSITCNAGVNRALVVSFSCYQRVTPASVTWNGITLNPVHAEGDSGDWQTRTFIAAIGDAVSNETINLLFTAIAAGNSVAALAYSVFENVDQSTPYTNADYTVDGAAGAIDHSQGYGLFAAGGGGDVDSISTAGYTGFGTSPLSRSGYLYGSANQTFDGASSGSDKVMWLIALNAATDGLDTDVHIGGILDGFTGLTPGAKYYVSNTAGTISTTPGSTSVLVGKAIDATRLLIIQS